MPRDDDDDTDDMRDDDDSHAENGACNESDHDALQSFLDDGWINATLHEVKSGKEATVYCCTPGPRLPTPQASSRTLTHNPSPQGRGENERPLLAAKVHRPLETRRFRNDAIYHAGRVHMARDGREKRAAEQKTAFGRKVQYGMWIEHEWETLNLLSRSGLPVPRPVARNDRAILMEYLGDASSPAPKLIEVELTPPEARRVFDQLRRAVETMLHLHRVHGDLSPYNVLYHQGRAMLIDFPQSIDPRLNPGARFILSRDLDNLCAWGKRHGIACDARRLENDLWRRFKLGEIG